MFGYSSCSKRYFDLPQENLHIICITHFWQLVLIWMYVLWNRWLTFFELLQQQCLSLLSLFFYPFFSLSSLNLLFSLSLSSGRICRNICIIFSIPLSVCLAIPCCSLHCLAMSIIAPSAISTLVLMYPCPQSLKRVICSISRKVYLSVTKNRRIVSLTLTVSIVNSEMRTNFFLAQE